MSKKVMIMGKWISVDEQTISFKGRHVDDIFIPWKKDKNNEGLIDIETIADHTNMRLTCSTDSHRRRKPIKQFSIDEVMIHFGLYILNGLNP